MFKFLLNSQLQVQETSKKLSVLIAKLRLLAFHCLENAYVQSMSCDMMHMSSVRVRPCMKKFLIYNKETKSKSKQTNR